MGLGLHRLPRLPYFVLLVAGRITPPALTYVLTLSPPRGWITSWLENFLIFILPPWQLHSPKAPHVPGSKGRVSWAFLRNQGASTPGVQQVAPQQAAVALQQFHPSLGVSTRGRSALFRERRSLGEKARRVPALEARGNPLGERGWRDREERGRGRFPYPRGLIVGPQSNREIR